MGREGTHVGAIGRTVLTVRVANSFGLLEVEHVGNLGPTELVIEGDRILAGSRVVDLDLSVFVQEADEARRSGATIQPHDEGGCLWVGLSFDEPVVKLTKASPARISHRKVTCQREIE